MGDFLTLPGGDLVEAGLADLAAGKMSVNALLLRIGRTRLGRSGLEIPDDGRESVWEHALYRLLEAQEGDDAHGRYNALIRRLVSFERALEQEHRSISERAR